MSASTPPIAQVLEQLGIPHRVFHHAGPVTSLAQAAGERGQTPDQVVRSLLFRLRGDEYVMVLMAGPDQVSWPKLRRYLGQSRVTRPFWTPLGSCLRRGTADCATMDVIRTASAMRMTWQNRRT